MKKIVIIILVTYVVSILSHIVYIVPKSNYGILDQTGKVKLKSYPKLKDVSFEYNADLSVEFTESINLELEKINFRFNGEIIGTVEINRNINDLENFGQTYTANNGKKVVIRKSYPLQKEFLRILGKNGEVYDSLEDGRFYIDIYIKDLKTNNSFIIKRDNISIYYESGGPKVFLPSV